MVLEGLTDWAVAGGNLCGCGLFSLCLYCSFCLLCGCVLFFIIFEPVTPPYFLVAFLLWTDRQDVREWYTEETKG